VALAVGHVAIEYGFGGEWLKAVVAYVGVVLVIGSACDEA